MTDCPSNWEENKSLLPSLSRFGQVLCSSTWRKWNNTRYEEACQSLSLSWLQLGVYFPSLSNPFQNPSEKRGSHTIVSTHNLSGKNVNLPGIFSAKVRDNHLFVVVRFSTACPKSIWYLISARLLSKKGSVDFLMETGHSPGAQVELDTN